VGGLDTLDSPVLEVPVGLPGIQGSVVNPVTADTQDFLVRAGVDIRGSVVGLGFQGLAGIPDSRDDQASADILGEVGTAGFAELPDTLGIRGLTLPPPDIVDSQDTLGSAVNPDTQDFAVRLDRLEQQERADIRGTLPPVPEHLGTRVFVDCQATLDSAGCLDTAGFVGQVQVDFQGTRGREAEEQRRR